MSTLLELADKARDVDTQLMALGGELTPEIEAVLCEIDDMLMSKADQYNHVLQRAQQSAMELQKRENEYKAARKALETATDRIRERIKIAMVVMGVNEISGKECRFKLSNVQPSLLITDVESVPDSFKKQIVTTEIDKAALKGALESGITVAGAELRASHALRISTSPRREV